MKRFQLHRDHDITGVSGAGVIADGMVFPSSHEIQFPDGSLLLPANWARITWRGQYPSTVLWSDLDHAYRVHGHGGATRFVFLD